MADRAANTNIQLSMPDVAVETAYNNQVSLVSQAEAEAGTVTDTRRWTPERVAQAIAALGGGGGMTTIVKTSDESKSNNSTIGLDSELFFNADANSVYFMELTFYAIGGAGDIKFDIEQPIGSSGVMTTAFWSSSGTYSLGNVVTRVFSLNAISSRHYIFQFRIATGGSAGNIGVSWSQDTDNATPTTLQKGSILRYIKAE